MTSQQEFNADPESMVQMATAEMAWEATDIPGVSQKLLERVIDDEKGRETALIKISNTGPERREALRIADIFCARVADTTIESFVFTLTGTPDKLDAFIDLMRSLGQVEVARSGVVAIARGAEQ